MRPEKRHNRDLHPGGASAGGNLDAKSFTVWDPSDLEDGVVSRLYAASWENRAALAAREAARRREFAEKAIATLPDYDELPLGAKP